MGVRIRRVSDLPPHIQDQLRSPRGLLPRDGIASPIDTSGRAGTLRIGPTLFEDLPLERAPRSKARHEETQLQTGMVRLFDQLVSPHQAILLAFANGEKRDGLAGKILKGMGVRAGTSDLVLVMPHPEIWWIEVKIDWQWTRNSKTAPWRRVQKQTTQSDNQILFEERVTALGWRYIIIASMEAWQDFLVERGLVRRFQSGAISRAPLPNPQPSHPSP